MIERCAPLTWQAPCNVNPALIPHYVEAVARRGGQFLIYKDAFLCVQTAMKNKRLFQKRVQEASDCLSRYKAASDTVDKMLLRHEMMQIARHAGAVFRLYVRDISFEGVQVVLKVPSVIAGHPDLKKSWDDGFADMGSWLYEDPN